MGSGKQLHGMNTHLMTFPGKKEAIWVHRGEGNLEVTEGRHVWLPTCLSLRLAKYKDAAKEKEDLCEFMFFAHGVEQEKQKIRGLGQCPADCQRFRPR